MDLICSSMERNVLDEQEEGGHKLGVEINGSGG